MVIIAYFFAIVNGESKILREICNFFNNFGKNKKKK